MFLIRMERQYIVYIHEIGVMDINDEFGFKLL